jgi:hypothetical protein
MISIYFTGIVVYGFVVYITVFATPLIKDKILFFVGNVLQTFTGKDWKESERHQQERAEEEGWRDTFR